MKFTPGLDWRGENGYVIAPPSRTEAGAYEWDEQFGYDRRLFDAPPWLYRLLDPPPPAPPKPLACVNDATGTPGRADALAALRNRASELERTAEGQRNAELFKAAARCADFVTLTDDEIETVLSAAAQRAGLEPREIRATLRSGIQTGRTNGR